MFFVAVFFRIHFKVQWFCKLQQLHRENHIKLYLNISCLFHHQIFEVNKKSIFLMKKWDNSSAISIWFSSFSAQQRPHEIDNFSIFSLFSSNWRASGNKNMIDPQNRINHPLAPCEEFFKFCHTLLLNNIYIELIEWTTEFKGGNGETTFKLSNVFGNGITQNIDKARHIS